MPENKESAHCRFITSFLDYFGDTKILDVPVTLVNEYRSTRDAALRIFQEIQNTNPNQLQLEGPDNRQIAQIHQQILLKTSYDKYAAVEIMNRFLKFYNDPESAAISVHTQSKDLHS